MSKDRGDHWVALRLRPLAFMLFLAVLSAALFFSPKDCLAALSFSESTQAAQSAAQEKPAAKSPPSQKPSSGPDALVTVLAQNWEKNENRIFASGNVEVHYKDIKLFADQVEVNTETKDVLAIGNVVLQSPPDEVVSAEKLFYNLDSRQGRMDKAFGMVQPSIFYQAETIERTSFNTYSFIKARLTSCTQPTPRWNFSCSRANFKKDDYVEMWNSVFRIKKIPILYLPYFRYPLNRERSTGFLMPQLGYSGVKGFFLGESFYWALARNMDATFDVDYYSSKGFGGGVEYRYLFSEGTGGEARLYYFVFKPGAGEESPNAYTIRLKHNQPLPLGFRAVANIDYQTSFDFLREFDNNFKRASVSNYRSEAYISRAWSYYNFSLRASRFETYFKSIDDSIITYYLPQATLNSFKIKLFSPLYFSFSSSFTSWKYGWRSEFDLGKEKYYDSVGFSPQFSMPFSRIPWLTINSSLTSNFVYYGQSFAPNTRRISDEPIFRFNYDFRLEWTGPVFYKIYQSAQAATKVKHLIEPYVSYRFDSPVSDPDRIITAYGFFRYHQLTYGLTNRILVKKEMPREVFTWDLRQTYYLSPEDSPLSIFKWEGEVPRYSDISSYVRFYPARKYSLDFSSGYNIYYDTLSFVRLGASVNSYTDPFFLQVSWFRSMNPWYKDVLGNRQQVGIVTRVEIPRLQLEAQGEFDFNILERKMLYSGISLVYHYQCLDLKADVRIFHYRATPEVQYRISVGLGNIGKTTDFMGGLGF
ncbi:MAG: LPS assembly protein LptD [Acidobacteriota bacterium]